ncbi:MAG: hypothetical protein HZB16_16880 [Armatimonadetes bacterium]|nr:hypothetical protein [Armatimonadota bacterium]
MVPAMMGLLGCLAGVMVDGANWPVTEHAAASNLALDARVEPELDRDSLLRNPGSGWVLYDDACGPVARAADYWRDQDQAARRYASIFYVRWRWAELEPTEGQYAWDHDANFQALVQGALDRGLRLAFRVYVASQDNAAQATPEYVRAAGAQGVSEGGAGGRSLWTPYLDDPVFQAKFAAFAAAFARKYNDPTRVDFVDAMGLGWWGEGHHLTLRDPASAPAVLRWILDAYRPFDRVLLGWQYNTGFGWQQDESEALVGGDYVIRRDGLGSMWFGDHEKERFRALWPRHPLFGEKCYWGGGDPAYPAGLDKRYGRDWKTWRDIDGAALADALAYHANTLDLRTVADAKLWLSYPDLVQRFVREGGYRLAPVEVAWPRAVARGGRLTVRHVWANLAQGVLPNLNQRWGQCYRPALALLPRDGGQPVVHWVDAAAEPGEWLAGAAHAYRLDAALPATQVPAGEYRLAVGIVNTTGTGLPDLKLALRVPAEGPWYPLGALTVR